METARAVVERTAHRHVRLCEVVHRPEQHACNVDSDVPLRAGATSHLRDFFKTSPSAAKPAPRACPKTATSVVLERSNSKPAASGWPLYLLTQACVSVRFQYRSSVDQTARAQGMRFRSQDIEKSKMAHQFTKSLAEDTPDSSCGRQGRRRNIKAR